MKLLKCLKKPVIYFGIYFLVSQIVMVGALLLSKDLNNVYSNVYSITFLSALLTLIIYSVMFRNKDISIVKFCGVGKISFKNTVLIVFMALSFAAVGSLLVGLLMQFFSSYSATSEMIQKVGDAVKDDGGNSIIPWIGIFSVTVGIPIFEEILFRGLIFNSIKEHLTVKWSIVLSAIIFAIAHGNPLQAIYTFLLGVILAMVYEKTKNILTPILVHVLYNLYGSVIVRIIAEKSLFIIGAITILSMVILPITIILFLKNNKLEKPIEIEMQ